MHSYLIIIFIILLETFHFDIPADHYRFVYVFYFEEYWDILLFLVLDLTAVELF